MNKQALRDIAIGSGDGLILPLAVASGLYGYGMDHSTIVLVVSLQILAGAITMGLGAYFSGKSEMGDYRSSIAEKNPGILRKAELHSLYKELGVPHEVDATVTSERLKDDTDWQKFISEYKPFESVSPAMSAITIALGYLAGGIIVLLPYLVNINRPMIVSCIVASVAMFVAGSMKSKANKERAWKGGVRLLVVGLAAAVAAFFVGRMF